MSEQRIRGIRAELKRLEQNVRKQTDNYINKLDALEEAIKSTNKQRDLLVYRCEAEKLRTFYWRMMKAFRSRMISLLRELRALEREEG